MRGEDGDGRERRKTKKTILSGQLIDNDIFVELYYFVVNFIFVITPFKIYKGG